MRHHTVITVYVLDDPRGVLYRLLRRGVPVTALRPHILDERVVEGNVVLDEGAEAVWRLATNTNPPTPFDSENSCIGVGDGTDPEDPKQTGLTGQNRYYKSVDSGYPVVAGRKATWRATFGPDEANFKWSEITVANGCSDDAVNLDRKVADMGTKQAGQTWVAQVVIELQ